jgi:hypothetical protein
MRFRNELFSLAEVSLYTEQGLLKSRTRSTQPADPRFRNSGMFNEKHTSRLIEWRNTAQDHSKCDGGKRQQIVAYFKAKQSTVLEELRQIQQTSHGAEGPQSGVKPGTS